MTSFASMNEENVTARLTEEGEDTQSLKLVQYQQFNMFDEFGKLSEMFISLMSRVPTMSVKFPRIFQYFSPFSSILLVLVLMKLN